MRIFLTGLVCLLLCGCFLAAIQQEPQQPPEASAQTVLVQTVDLSDKQPQRKGLGWPATIGIALCMFMMPIVMTKARKL